MKLLLHRGLSEPAPDKCNENTALEADKSDLHSFLKSPGIKNRTRAPLPFPAYYRKSISAAVHGNRSMSHPSEQRDKQEIWSRAIVSADITAILLDLFRAGVWDGTIDILMGTKFGALKEMHA